MAGEKTEQKAAAKPSGSDDNLIAALCYIYIFFIGIIVALYVLLTEKKQNKFLAFHAWQSLLLCAVLLVAGTVLGIGIGILGMIIGVLTGGIGTVIVPCFALIIIIGSFALMLFLAWKAYQGEKYKLPVIGDFAEKQAAK